MVLKLDPDNLDAQNEIKKLNQVGSCLTAFCIFGGKGGGFRSIPYNGLCLRFQDPKSRKNARQRRR